DGGQDDRSGPAAEKERKGHDRADLRFGAEEDKPDDPDRRAPARKPGEKQGRPEINEDGTLTDEERDPGHFHRGHHREMQAEDRAGAELRGSPRPARPRWLRKRERHRSARQQQRAERDRKPKLPGGAEVEQGKQHRGQPEGGRVCPYLGPVALSDQSSGCLGKTGTVGRNALEPETAGKPVIAEVVAGIAGSRDGE